VGRLQVLSKLLTTGPAEYFVEVLLEAVEVEVRVSVFVQGGKRVSEGGRDHMPLLFGHLVPCGD
jgi:hypothetical protein